MNRSGRFEKGQAMVETAVFSLLLVLLALALLALIPIHRSRTAATAAAFACAQFVSQALDPQQALDQAERVGRRTIEAAWSAAQDAGYQVQAWTGGQPGAAGGCSVSYLPPMLFNGLLNLNPPAWVTVSFRARTEPWKARWP